MPKENSQPESAEKKKRDVDVRDLKPKTDQGVDRPFPGSINQQVKSDHDLPLTGG